MNDDEKLERAKDFRDISHSNQVVAERRTAELADEFTRLEVQIATILFGIMGFFIKDIPDILAVKFAFFGALLSLIGSLGLGLLHIKCKEGFWNDILNKRVIRFHSWNSVLKKELSYEEAKGVHDGTALEKGNVVGSPMWTWILQTIFLAMAIVLLLTLSAIFIFS